MVITTRSQVQAYSPSDSDESDDSLYGSDTESDCDEDLVGLIVEHIMNSTRRKVTRKKRKRPVKKQTNRVKRRRFNVPKNLRAKDWESLLKLAEASLQKGYKDCSILEDAYPVLMKIDNLVGMQEFKQSLAEKIVAYACETPEKGAMHHVSIVGPTGSGKTTIARLIGELYAAMGIVEDPNILMGTQSSMIGGYVGHTAIQTNQMVDKAMETGRPLFMDEFYGFTGDYGDKCIQTLLPHLTDNADSFVLIVAGYEKEMKDVFKANEGLRRRFPWHFVLRSYGPDELMEIFVRSFDERHSVPNDLGASFFQKYSSRFTQNGGSVQNFVEHVKVAHNFRTHGTTGLRGTLTMADLETAVLKLPTEDDSKPPAGMYL